MLKTMDQLPGVTVTVKGTRTVVATDANGNYRYYCTHFSHPGFFIYWI